MTARRLHLTAAGALLAVALTAFLSCSDMGGEGGRLEVVKDQKFYSAAEPGKWAPFAADHEPQCDFVPDGKGGRVLEVSVPFTRRRDTRHYVETIALFDARRREIAKKTFNRGERAEASFRVPADALFPLYVVSRCNRHDMWEKKIEGKNDEEGE